MEYLQHLTWAHYLGTAIVLFFMSLLLEGVRTFLSDLLVKRIGRALKAAWMAFFDVKPLPKAPSGGAPDDEKKETKLAALESKVEANNHNTMARMDDLSRAVHVAATTISDVAQETRRTLELFDKSTDEHLNEMHLKINQTREQVAGLSQKIVDMPDIVVGKLLTSFALNKIQPMPPKGQGTGT